MSYAGVQSNRGDGYQTLVAFDWALIVLSDPDFQWLEVDSVTYSVDDVVVGKTDGSLICCQCKKNQKNYDSWKISDLADELKKASNLLGKMQGAEVFFYSRSPFGAIAKLREHSTTQTDEACYLASLTPEHQKTDAMLETILAVQAPKLSTFEFLRRTKFETTPEVDRMEAKLRRDLRILATNSKAAFNALWTNIDQLGARMINNNISTSPQHHLTKEDLKVIVQQAGAILVPPVSLLEARTSFASISAIGREWQRSIAGKQIVSPIVEKILAAIDDGKRSILLTGLPGSGKTCVILAVQDALERRAQTDNNIVPLFIQAREYADLPTAEERQAHGLTAQWVEKAARLAEEVKVVVVIDSLDVLSISREHKILRYFLAQIDRLLLIPNIIVITACRDFDRHYDRRIAERKWDCELKCLPLNWESEVAPLLASLDINTETIDDITRELIRNPRELALFVELAQNGGSFNVVTSQALAQRYLDTIVRANSALGEMAMQAIEAIADEMLKSRSLAVPHQRFSATQDIQRALCSLNVLQETRDGKLTFGHQTLLDVLVISGALRKGYTLNKFIQELPPVPFVRPSIRSFVAQLAIGDRSEFRKQLRTVLTGSAAFHIRRLIAEFFAEQIPIDDDWPLIRELHSKNKDVFQIIYTQAERIEWHYFWLKHLIPKLKDTRDVDGLTSHTYRISKWKNQDTKGVIQFWIEILTQNWVDSNVIVKQLEHHLCEINEENLELIAPLLEKLLGMPRQEYCFLGRTVARCVAAGIMDDFCLWRFVIGDISDSDVIECKLGKKLNCKPDEFGNSKEGFFSKRMECSTKLLDLALESIEYWSQRKSSRNSGNSKNYQNGLLNESSHRNVHSQNNYRHFNSLNMLLNAIEAAILIHAETNSSWWQNNRERLCFNREGALRYFAILACTKVPEANIGLIERMLCDKELLEAGLTYELGTLINASFIYLDAPSQDRVMACILTLWNNDFASENHKQWILREQAQLIVAIPGFLRSPETQVLLDAYEKEEELLIRQPEINSRFGNVTAPFSFEVFLGSSDSGVLRLLSHYTGYTNDCDFYDYLVGGEREVGCQLSEAASRQTTRFLRLLTTNWDDISERFRNDIMKGVAKYLKYRYGKLQPNGPWTPLEEPDACELAGLILDELERHASHWHHRRAESEAIEACAYVINDTQNAGRLVFIADGFANLEEESANENDYKDLIFTGINMTGGNVANALIEVANRFEEFKIPFPEALLPTLKRFASHRHPAIRAVILMYLPYLQYQNPELGWDLFQRIMLNAKGLWETAEHCLYQAYNNHFDIVAPLLARILNEGSTKDLEIWGRISALAALSNRTDFTVFLDDLKSLNVTDAWMGAASVWTNLENIKHNRDQCFFGIESGLKADISHAEIVAQEVLYIFYDHASVIPENLIRLYFNVLEKDDENKHHGNDEFVKWLNLISVNDPILAIDCTEIYLDYIKSKKTYLYDYENNHTQLMTRLFAEAEEREEADQGEMLKRVVLNQDTLLSLGVESINAWLKAAERP